MSVYTSKQHCLYPMITKCGYIHDQGLTLKVDPYHKVKADNVGTGGNIGSTNVTNS